MINVNKIARQRSDLQSTLMDINNIYIEGLMLMNKDETLYPDANNSQRISYVRVSGAVAQDGLVYTPFTNIYGALVKYRNNTGDNQFYLPSKIRDLVSEKNFGENASGDNYLVVNFLTDAHTTSGSSGSPVINAEGELVGVNFDRIWQGVASDYKYDKDISRSVTVDIRYVLFIIEKYSPSGYILNELRIK